jgi:hypothetical protein
VPEVQEDAEQTLMTARTMTDRDIPYDNTKNASNSALNQIMSTEKLNKLIKKIPISIIDRASTEKTLMTTDWTITEFNMTGRSNSPMKKSIIIEPSKIGRGLNERVKTHEQNLRPGKTPLVESFRNDFFSHLRNYGCKHRADGLLSKKKDSFVD